VAAQVVDELRQFIRTEFDVPADDREFSDDVHLFDYGYVDSFGAVKRTSFVEENFSEPVNESSASRSAWVADRLTG
jgi:D-alanine--poly(phosphoribitol) ligase subunit 2